MNCIKVCLGFVTHLLRALCTYLDVKECSLATIQLSNILARKFWLRLIYTSVTLGYFQHTDKLSHRAQLSYPSTATYANQSTQVWH